MEGNDVKGCLYTAMVEFIYELYLYEKLDKHIEEEVPIPAPKINVAVIMMDPQKQ